MEYKMIGSGAEAVIYYDGGSEVIKERKPKSYRHPEIDSSLRKSRTRRESKVLQKLREIRFPSPSFLGSDEKRMSIIMEHIAGEKLRDVFDRDPEGFSREIGQRIAELHNSEIIHHDLTTSNMILRNGSVHFIDFGLSFFSKKTEDMAVDLHLLDRAMESRHHSHYPECFNTALNEYSRKANLGSEVVKKFNDVRNRGRNKNKH